MFPGLLSSMFVDHSLSMLPEFLSQVVPVGVVDHDK